MLLVDVDKAGAVLMATPSVFILGMRQKPQYTIADEHKEDGGREDHLPGPAHAQHRVVRGQEIILNMSDCGKTLLGVKETLKLEV